MKTQPPPMWGEVLEEDLYDSSIPFYDHSQAIDELNKRNARIQQMLEQDQKIREALQSGRRNEIDSKKLKRKVIYVYEDDNS